MRKFGPNAGAPTMRRFTSPKTSPGRKFGLATVGIILPSAGSAVEAPLVNEADVGSVQVSLQGTPRATEDVPREVPNPDPPAMQLLLGLGLNVSYWTHRLWAKGLVLV